MSRGRVIYGNLYGQPRQYFIDGVECTEAEFNKRFPPKPISAGNLPNVNMETSASWPRLSDALGVGKGQKAKAEEVFRKKGVPTEFVPDGAGGYSAKILNNAHQIKVLKALGMHNKDGGYQQTAG